MLRLQGKRMTETSRLRNTVALAGAGAKVRLDVLRGGKRKVIDVQLGAVPGQKRVARKSRKKAQTANERIGMTLTPLDQQLRRQHRIGSDIHDGVVITDVQPGSIASRAGMQVGDVLLEVARAPFKDIDDAVKRIEKANGSLLLTVRRGQHNMYLVLNLE